ncbi:MAG: hypothetical protein PHQ20_04565 [Candidatus Moranbacteria bacterium]|nr:hypothetical protein [Candidatus Moranbacteria bacterium]
MKPKIVLSIVVFLVFVAATEELLRLNAEKKQPLVQQQQVQAQVMNHAETTIDLSHDKYHRSEGGDMPALSIHCILPPEEKKFMAIFAVEHEKELWIIRKEVEIPPPFLGNNK